MAMNNNFEFIVPHDKKECEYIGFDFQSDNTKFIFPCRYIDDKADEKEKKSEAKKIITLLKRIRQDYVMGGYNKELFQFYSMIWLILDYIENGYYVETETISKCGANGKINWKKTIKSNSIFFDGGNIIYRDFIRDKRKTDESRIITLIYKCCLDYSVKRLGFLFGVEQVEKSVFSMESDKTYMSYCLTSELNNTFRDYKKQLINHLLTIINNVNDKHKETGFSIYDKEFEYVFETLVNNVFGTSNVKEHYNQYIYNLDGIDFSASKLRPDTIMEDVSHNTYYIVDSKYYNYGYTDNTDDLPQSSSIAKQIGYNHYLREKLVKDKVYNKEVKSIFLLPYASKEQDKELLKYVGYAGSDNNQEINDRVAVCLVDLKQLINTYLQKDDKLTPENLIELVEKQNIW